MLCIQRHCFLVVLALHVVTTARCAPGCVILNVNLHCSSVPLLFSLVQGCSGMCTSCQALDLPSLYINRCFGPKALGFDACPAPLPSAPGGLKFFRNFIQILKLLKSLSHVPNVSSIHLNISFTASRNSNFPSHRGPALPQHPAWLSAVLFVHHSEDHSRRCLCSLFYLHDVRCNHVSRVQAQGLPGSGRILC